MVEKRLTKQITEKSLCTMMFADDIIFMKKNWEEMETKLKSWRVTLERGGMKARRSKT